MNFSEFKERIGAEPRSTDPELLAARREDESLDQAWREAEALEDRIEAALNFPVESDELLGRVLATPALDRKPRFNWLAMAASLVAVVGVAAIAWQQLNQPGNLEEYLQAHYGHDGAAVLARASADFDGAEVNRVLANFDASATPALAGQVSYIKICPTLHGRGAHMVLATEAGPVTVIYMPDTEVQQSTLVRFDGMDAQVISLEAGSAAIIGPQGHAVSGIEALLQTSISRESADA